MGLPWGFPLVPDYPLRFRAPGPNPPTVGVPIECPSRSLPQKPKQPPLSLHPPPFSSLPVPATAALVRCRRILQHQRRPGPWLALLSSALCPVLSSLCPSLCSHAGPDIDDSGELGCICRDLEQCACASGWVSFRDFRVSWSCLRNPANFTLSPRTETQPTRSLCQLP